MEAQTQAQTQEFEAVEIYRDNDEIALKKSRLTNSIHHIHAIFDSYKELDLDGEKMPQITIRDIKKLIISGEDYLRDILLRKTGVPKAFSQKAYKELLKLPEGSERLLNAIKTAGKMSHVWERVINSFHISESYELEIFPDTIARIIAENTIYATSEKELQMWEGLTIAAKAMEKAFSNYSSPEKHGSRNIETFLDRYFFFKNQKGQAFPNFKTIKQDYFN